MKITQITYGKTINIGNYQSVRVDFTGEVSEHETYEEALATLKVVTNLAEVQIKKENGVK